MGLRAVVSEKLELWVATPNLFGVEIQWVVGIEVPRVQAPPNKFEGGTQHSVTGSPPHSFGAFSTWGGFIRRYKQAMSVKQAMPIPPQAVGYPNVREPQYFRVMRERRI